jgi:ribonuclease R
VKLDTTGADGFIPARTVGDEYFRYHEERHALVGATSGESYRLGDRVTVRLVEAAPVAGALRFELLSEARAGARQRPGTDGPVRKRSAGEREPHQGRMRANNKQKNKRRR